MEEIISEHIYLCRKEKNVTGNSQHGFTECQSCLAKLTYTHDKTTGFRDEGRAVDVIYIDFSKAFKILFHHILVSELGCYGRDVQKKKKKQIMMLTGGLLG